MRAPDDYDHTRIFDGNVFVGTYIAYTATPWGDFVPFGCDVEIRSLDETRVNQFRAYRKTRELRGLKVRPLSDDVFQKEVCVIFGPQLSPKQAIAALERMVAYIKSNGLLIGRAKADGDLHCEQTDGTIDPPLPIG